MTEFVVDIAGGVVVIKLLLERATLGKAEIFKNILEELIEKGERKIIIDCKKVEFMDSTFLGSLVAPLKKINLVGGDIRLVFANKESPVRLMFETTRMLKIFKSYFSDVKAIRDFKNN